MTLETRAYQSTAVSVALKSLRSQDRRALVVMATGLGKTITAALIAQQFSAKRTLFLVHNNFILEHAIAEFGKVFDEKSTTIARYNGTSRKGAEDADIVFATWQTMGRHLKKWPKNYFGLLIVDEAHHTGAETYLPVAEYFSAPRLGITATPDRMDELDIRDVFGEETVNISLEEAIARGWLPRIEYHVITDKSLNNEVLQRILGEIREGKRRFTMAEVDRQIFIAKREEEIATLIGEYKEQAIVFCRSIAHAEKMSAVLTVSDTFHSKKGWSSRDTLQKNLSVLEALRDGTVKKVCAVDAFNEGVDVPSVGLVVFCRVTGSTTIFRQQLGRGLRPGKDKLIVLDFVGNLERIRQVMAMVNTIADLHEQYTKYDTAHDGYVRQSLEVSGTWFDFTFSDQIVDLMEVLKHCEEDFYPTWQEASEAAVALGIKSQLEYRSVYKEDARLPSNPNRTYSDFLVPHS